MTATTEWFTVGRPAQDEPVVKVNGRTGSVQVLTAAAERVATEDEIRAAWNRFAKVVLFGARNG